MLSIFLCNRPIEVPVTLKLPFKVIVTLAPLDSLDMVFYSDVNNYNPKVYHAPFQSYSSI